MTSLPAIVLGKDPAIVIPAISQYLPEINVVHVCHSAESAKIEIPPLLRGEAVVPASGLGSNTERLAAEQHVPLVVIAGGGFTADEVESIRREDTRSVPWVKIEITNVPLSERPPNPKYLAIVVANVKRCIREHGLMDGPVNESNVGAVWEC